MKKTLSAVALLLTVVTLCVLCLAGCAKTDPIGEKPESLEVWLNERVGVDFIKKHEIIPGWIGANEYYGAGYHAVKGADGTSRDPEVYVKYLLMAYPEGSADKNVVTGIAINDPAVNVYGFCFGMSEKSFYDIFGKKGFEKVPAGTSSVPAVTNGVVTVSLTDFELVMTVDLAAANETTAG